MEEHNNGKVVSKTNVPPIDMSEFGGGEFLCRGHSDGDAAR